MNTDSKNVVDLYRRQAASWARNRSRDLIERKWLDRFLDLLPENPSVLDLGCGFGDPIGRYLIERGCALTGIDTSPELIDLAKAALPGGHWIVSDMRDLRLDRSFDGFLAWNSSFHLTPEDQRHMFSVFERHATDTAALMFTTGSQAGVAIGEFAGEALYHASLDEREYITLLQQHTFEVVEHVIEDPDCGHACVWLAHRNV
ncbi:MAG: trans-aconitate 2-methyltransferase [Paracoccaceae bacterium]